MKTNFDIVAVDVPLAQPQNRVVFQDIIWSKAQMATNTGATHRTTQVLAGAKISGLARNPMYVSFSDDFDFGHHSSATVRITANCKKIVDVSNPLYDTIKTINNNPRFDLSCSACRIGLPDDAQSSFAGVWFM